MIIQNTTPFRKLIWYKRVLGGHIPSVEKTVSGSIIHVTDALAKRVKNLSVFIEPVQSGSGDPSPENIRPITGHTGVNVVRAGKNLLDPSNPKYADTLVGTDGTKSSNSNFNTWLTDLPSFTISINVTESQNAGRVVVFNADNTVASYSNFSTTVGRRAISISLTSGQYALISIRKTATEYQLEIGDETAYEAYQGTTYSVNWNLLNLADSENGGINTSGANVNASNNWRSKGYIPIEAGKAYTLSASSTFADIVCRIYWYDSSKNFISPRVVENKKVTATAPNNAAYARYTYALSTDFTQSIAENGELQFEQGSDKTSYKPYCGTVYSGTLDVLTGVLTVDKVAVDLGSVTYTYDATYTRFYFTPSPTIKNTNVRTLEMICSCYQNISDGRAIGSVPNDSVYNGASTVNIKTADYTDPSAFKAAMSGQTLVYPLATPITHQLTPTQVKLLLGENSIWADTGDTELTYLAEA